MTAVPPKIELLPEHLIDQIKAGEVIERPGNLLKEILENAIDAGATKLELHLQNNGLDLISLKDNGHGMSLDDLPLAFSRHATSKIGRFEDLYRLHTFGFRGEALASIASISKLQCISFMESSPKGAEIRIQGGETLFHGTRQASGFVHGTELVIQDLFYNTPARLKFIQSQNSEKQFIRKVIYSFILSNPKIEFQVKINDDEKEIFPAEENLLGRLRHLLPKARESILYSERFYEENELEVHLIPGQFKAPIKWQYIFINGRMILDKQFHRVLSNALLSSFGNDDFHYMASLHLPAESIDVNVHPNKTLIKCLESSKVIGLLTSTIKEMASPKKNAVQPPTPRETIPISANLLDTLESNPGLLQERHEYNMEGQFSPHHLSTLPSPSGVRWLDSEFILREVGGRTMAYSAKRSLEKYIYHRLQSSASTIPLLVSEPYPLKGLQAERLGLLTQGGLEMEKLGPETMVLRGIPEWMNGFPLKEVIRTFLQEKDFRGFILHPEDWSSSTWIEIIEALPLDELIKDKVALDLSELLREKLK